MQWKGIYYAQLWYLTFDLLPESNAYVMLINRTDCLLRQSAVASNFYFYFMQKLNNGFNNITSHSSQ